MLFESSRMASPMNPEIALTRKAPVQTAVEEDRVVPHAPVHRLSRVLKGERGANQDREAGDHDERDVRDLAGPLLEPVDRGVARHEPDHSENREERDVGELEQLRRLPAGVAFAMGAPLRRMPRPSAASSGRPSAPRRNSVERPADG
jgi:hypothetical protein